MDDYLVFALSIVLAINGMLFLGQASITNIGQEMGAPVGTFYDVSGSIICRAESGNCEGDLFILDDTNPTAMFPENQPIESGEGGFFTDMFASIRNFFSNTLGLGYVVDILKAPNTFLKMMGLPTEVSFAITAMWYLLTLFLLLAFMWGR